MEIICSEFYSFLIFTKYSFLVHFSNLVKYIINIFGNSFLVHFSFLVRNNLIMYDLILNSWLVFGN